MSSSTDQTILSASAFDNSIGVNTHVAYAWGSYNDLALVEDDLRYLGVTKLRDSVTSIPSAQPVLDGLAAAGFKFDMIVPSSVPAAGTAGLQQFIQTLNTFEANHPGSISAVEGLNEVNHQAFSYQGSSSVSAAAQFQSVLYYDVKSDAALSGVPVYNFTVAYNDAQAYAQLGNISGITNYANVHAYASTDMTPASALQSALSAVTSVIPGEQAVITETGYTTQANTPYLGVDQTAEAKLILNTLVDAYKAGVGTTYLYQLLDLNSSSSDTNPEDHFGLFNSDGTPKLAATAIHNLTTILSDNGTGGHQPTTPLGYSLSGLPASGNSMVLGKSNGAYDLVVWAEPPVWNSSTSTDISNAAQPVTVNLGGVRQSVNVYDPLGGTTPIATYTNVSSITVPVSNHPVIIEIDAPPSQAAAPGPVDVSGTAAEIATQLPDLAAAGTVQSITLTDSHVLPVASVATMQYMISHYQAALSTIQGGYSFSVTSSTAAWSLTTTYDSSGNLLSTSNTGVSNGLPTSTTVVYADGSSDTTIYAAGVKTVETHTGTDGTRTTDAYDASGAVTSQVVQQTNGFYSTTLFSNGVKTQAYILNADHSQDNWTYNVAGRSYVTLHQHLDATGKLTSATGLYANGVTQFSQTFNSDGSTTLDTYNASGVQLTETDVHADGSKDAYVYAITGQPYTTRHDSYDPTGFLTSTVETHADGSLAFRFTETKAGTKTTDTYDASGVITTEVVQQANGSYSTALYTAGVETQAYILNADQTRDNWSYDISGQSYTTLHQHVDASGKLVSAAWLYANGVAEYVQTFNSDGSNSIDTYSTAGVLMAETDNHAGGSKDVYTYDITGQPYTTQHNSYDSTGFLTSTVQTHANGSLAFDFTETTAGTKTTAYYDANGVITTEVVQQANGYYSTALYSGGVETQAYILNADQTRDNWSYDVTGQSYTTLHQHLDATGRLASVTGLYASGVTDYTETFNADGSTTVDDYNTAGVLTTEIDTHADGSKDVYHDNITGQAYTTEHDSYDPTGFLTSTVQTHADGSLAFDFTETTGGTKTTSTYDAHGVITSEVVQEADGYYSTAIYTGGVETAAYIVNPDHSQDNWTYDVTGQDYTTQHQHLDASGNVVAVTRTHADGSLEYTDVVNSDGSTTVDNYNSTGVKTLETDTHADHSVDVYNYALAGQPGAIQHAAYNSAGALQYVDLQNADGTHAITAVASGLTVTGGNGATLTLIGNATTVLFTQGSEQINNFQAGAAANHDTIEIAKSLAADYSHLQITQSGSDAVVNIAAGDAIVLKNLSAASLSHSNFAFV
jgi:hypothetical protein